MFGYPEIVEFTLGVSMKPVKASLGIQQTNLAELGIKKVSTSTLAIGQTNDQPLAIAQKFKHDIGA